MTEHAQLTLAAALAAGVVALIFARHLRTPGIILLLGVGVGLGEDGLGLIDPKALGPLLDIIVGIAVAIILFEGGLHLNLGRLKSEGRVIRRLITLGSIVTAIGGGLAASHFMGWNWQLSLLFGTLVIVTGPTVVTPLLRRLRVNRNLHTILEAEGVLIDPVGAIIAVVALDFVLAHPSDSLSFSILGYALGLFTTKLALGALVGIAGGAIIGLLLRYEKLVPDELENILTLSIVVFIFEASNALLAESGIMTVTVAGIVVGSMKVPMHRRLVEFKEQLTIMLIGILFVLLAADVRLVSIEALGFGGICTVAALMFIVRPVNVLACTAGSSLRWQEKFFISWLAPRGIVAAAVASLFASDLTEANIPGGEPLRALVFLVIASTVVIQGFTALPLAVMLKIRRKSNFGYMIIGANILGRTLAKYLKTKNEPVVFIDRNPHDCGLAESEGYQAYFGNALEESLLNRTRVESFRAIIAMTPNESVNLMVLTKIKELTKEPELRICLVSDIPMKRDAIEKAGVKSIFAGHIEFDLWSHRARQNKLEISEWIYLGKEPFDLGQFGRGDITIGKKTHALLPFLSRNTSGHPIPLHSTNILHKKQSLIVGYLEDDQDIVKDWMTQHQFEAKS